MKTKELSLFQKILDDIFNISNFERKYKIYVNNLTNIMFIFKFS